MSDELSDELWDIVKRKRTWESVWDIDFVQIKVKCESVVSYLRDRELGIRDLRARTLKWHSGIGQSVLYLDKESLLRHSSKKWYALLTEADNDYDGDGNHDPNDPTYAQWGRLHQEEERR